eukprot:3117950-Pyramimonas_sp.AAC.1
MENPSKKYKNQKFKKIFCHASCSDSELSSACEELHEVPGGDQVDGSPPAPVSLAPLTIAFPLLC